MKTFTDPDGRTWVINLTIGAMRHVRDTIGVDLTAPEAPVDADGKPTSSEKDPPLSHRLAASLSLFVDVLYQVVTFNAPTPCPVAEFLASLPPSICRAAREAFLEEWISFFRDLGRPDQADVVHAALDLQAAAEKQLARGIKELTRIAQVDLMTRTNQAIQQQADRSTSGSCSTNSPESSASCPTP